MRIFTLALLLLATSCSSKHYEDWPNNDSTNKMKYIPFYAKPEPA